MPLALADGILELDPPVAFFGSAQRVVLAIEASDSAVCKVRLLLISQGFEVQVVTGVDQCLEALRQGGVRLVLASWRQVEADAASLCRSVEQLPVQWRAPVVVLGSEGDGEAPYACFAAGAIDYLRLPFDPVELLWRMRLHLGPGRALASGEFLRAGCLRLDGRNHRVAVRQREVALTPSECAILRMLMVAPGRALSIETLLVEALGYPPKLGNPEVVRTHIRNLRLKLEDNPARPALVVNLPRIGYLLRA